MPLLVLGVAGMMDVQPAWAQPVQSALIDPNGSGFSEVWEQAYGAFGLDPNGDADGDGISNKDEAAAGTDPFDPGSGLAVTSKRWVENGLMIRWQAVAGRTYSIETCSQLGVTPWRACETLTGYPSGEILSLIDRPTGATAFFRVVVMGDAAEFPLGLSGGLFDSDGDGQSDAAELLAGTDPFDAGSRFSISEVRPASGWVVEWATVPGKLYQLQSSQRRPTEWLNEGPALLASGDRLVVCVEGAVSLRFLRVQVSDVDSNNDGVSDWEEWATGLAVTRSNSMINDGADVATIKALLATPANYTVTAPRASALVGGDAPGLIEIRRIAGFGPIRIPLVVSGSAVAGVDVAPFAAVATIPLGQSATTLTFSALAGARSGTNIDIAIAGGAHASVTFVRERAISVKDLGALGDGVTDDTEAIQAAIDLLEESPEINTLHFPTGTYLLGSRTGDTRTFTCSWRHLLLGARDLVGRDIFFTGEAGARLFSETGELRTHTLVVDASCRSLSFSGLTWEQGCTPRVGNGSDGVALVRHDGRSVEGVEFSGCVFRNCHGALFTYGHGYDVRGTLKYLFIHDSQILNPYGANSKDSLTKWGGGAQVGLSEWVGTAVYDHNLFDGGGEDMTDAETCPGGRVKDGCHFGSPMRLEFTNNIVKRMGVEAVFQTNDNTYAGKTIEAFTMPPVDSSSLVSVQMDNIPSTFIAGDMVNVRILTTSSSVGKNNLLLVQSFDPLTRTLQLRNDGYAGNDLPGTLLPADLQVFLNRCDEPSLAEVRNNRIDGTLPPGANLDTEPAGIVVSARSRITGNTIVGQHIGILIYPEDHTPLFPASRGAIIDNNSILTRDSRDYPGSYTYGIQSWANDDVIVSNRVFVPETYRIIGISARGRNSRIEKNTIISQLPENNGYVNLDRGVGIGCGNQSTNARVIGNTTFGMDVGVGPDEPNQSVPHAVSLHRSVNDVLAVDPTGLSNQAVP